MKQLKHIFRQPNSDLLTGNMPLIGGDVCIICNKSAREIGLRRLEVVSSYNINNIENGEYLKCLTENEYTIKKLLE